MPSGIRKRLFAGWIATFALPAALIALSGAPGGASAAAPEHIPACDWYEPSDHELEIGLVREKKFGNLLVCVEVNGVAGLMILDTGSSTTLVSEKLAGCGVRDFRHPVTPLSGSGWRNSGRWGEATIHLGSRYWVNRRVIVDDLRPMSESLDWQIDGVFGEDLLRQYRSVVIDYDKNTVRLIGP